MIEYLELAIQAAYSIWILWFSILGFIFALVPKALGMEFSLEALYWIGLIGFPIFMFLGKITNNLMSQRAREYHELKEKYRAIIPVIDISIERELEERENGK